MEEWNIRRWVNVVRICLAFGREGWGGGEDKRCIARVNSITGMLSGHLFAAATYRESGGRDGRRFSRCSRTHSGNVPALLKTLCCGLSVGVVKHSSRFC